MKRFTSITVGIIALASVALFINAQGPQQPQYVVVGGGGANVSATQFDLTKNPVIITNVTGVTGAGGAATNAINNNNGIGTNTSLLNPNSTNLTERSTITSPSITAPSGGAVSIIVSGVTRMVASSVSSLVIAPDGASIVQVANGTITLRTNTLINGGATINGGLTASSPIVISGASSNDIDGPIHFGSSINIDGTLSTASNQIFGLNNLVIGSQLTTNNIPGLVANIATLSSLSQNNAFTGSNNFIGPITINGSAIGAASNFLLVSNPVASGSLTVINPTAPSIVHTGGAGMTSPIALSVTNDSIATTGAAIQTNGNYQYYNSSASGVNYALIDTAGNGVFSPHAQSGGGSGSGLTNIFNSQFLVTQGTNIGLASTLSLNIVQATNGIFGSNSITVIGGQFNGNGAGISNIVSSSITGASTNGLVVISTNFISGQLYTNLTGSAALVQGLISLTTAAVTGDAEMDLQMSGANTNSFGISTTVAVSLAMNYTNLLSGVVSNGGTFVFTNRSSGAGNTATLSQGQLSYANLLIQGNSGTFNTLTITNASNLNGPVTNASTVAYQVGTSGVYAYGPNGNIDTTVIENLTSVAEYDFYSNSAGIPANALVNTGDTITFFWRFTAGAAAGSYITKVYATGDATSTSSSAQSLNGVPAWVKVSCMRTNVNDLMIYQDQAGGSLNAGSIKETHKTVSFGTNIPISLGITTNGVSGASATVHTVKRAFESGL